MMHLDIFWDILKLTIFQGIPFKICVGAHATYSLGRRKSHPYKTEQALEMKHFIHFVPVDQNNFCVFSCSKRCRAWLPQRFQRFHERALFFWTVLPIDSLLQFNVSCSFIGFTHKLNNLTHIYTNEFKNRKKVHSVCIIFPKYKKKFYSINNCIMLSIFFCDYILFTYLTGGVIFI